MLKQELWKEIEEKSDKLLELCADLIRIDSQNPPGKTEAVTGFITNYLEQAGIPWEIKDRTGSDPNILATYGSDFGTSGRTLLVNGHSDVVPVGDLERWEHPPFSALIQDGLLHGRGASDMKCGLGGLIFAMATLARHKIRLKGRVQLAVVPDEEVSGVNGTKWLVGEGLVRGDGCLVAEPTCVDNCEVGQKGTLWIKLKAKGQPAHGSLAPFVGENANEKLLAAIEAIRPVRDLVPQLPAEVKETMRLSKEKASEQLKSSPGAEYNLDHMSFNLGCIHGGNKVNMVPDYAEAEIDCRIPIGLSVETVAERVRYLLKASGISDVELDLSRNSEPNHTDTQSDVVQMLANNAEAVLGQRPKQTYQWASSDARYYRYAGIPTLQYGPAILSGIHSYNEAVRVEDVIACTKVYLGLMLDFCELEV